MRLGRLRTHAAIGRQPRPTVLHRVPIPLRPHLFAACSEDVRYLWQPGYRRDRESRYRRTVAEIETSTSREQIAGFLWFNYALWRLALLVDAVRSAPLHLRLCVELATWRQDAAQMREALALRNQGMVETVAWRLRHGQNDHEDLVGDCQLRLLHCIDLFDGGNGCCFSSFAFVSIYRAGLRSRALRFRHRSRTRQMDESFMEPSGSAGDPASKVGLLDLDGLMDAPETGLTERERFVISRRFGLDGHEHGTFDQIKLDLKLSRERVRQIEVAALTKFRLALGIA